MAGFCALAEFDFHHLDLRFIRLFGKSLWRKASVGIAAAKIAAADLPDDVAPVLLMVPARALSEHADSIGDSRRC